MTYYYRLLLQYKGCQYQGWQIQPPKYGKTVQGELNLALIKLSKSESIRTMGAGRTDAGVHALGQVVKVEMPLNINPQNLVRALNANLPDDIRVIKADFADQSFMPTVHARSKEYQYLFTCERTFTAFQNDFIVNYPFALDIELMKEACKILVGTHDFSNFYTEGTEVSSNVREILQCEILQIAQGGWQMLPSHYAFRIVGTGFLKQMVRLLMGAVWNIGRGKVSLEELRESLGPIKRERLGIVAPPHGLYMVRVIY